jgi:hypothetical protein
MSILGRSRDWYNFDGNALNDDIIRFAILLLSMPSH